MPMIKCKERYVMAVFLAIHGDTNTNWPLSTSVYFTYLCMFCKTMTSCKRILRQLLSYENNYDKITALITNIVTLLTK